MGYINALIFVEIGRFGPLSLLIIWRVLLGERFPYPDAPGLYRTNNVS